MAVIIVHLPEKSKARFANIAKKRGLSQSKFARLLINEGYRSLLKAEKVKGTTK